MNNVISTLSHCGWIRLSLLVGMLLPNATAQPLLSPADRAKQAESAYESGVAYATGEKGPANYVEALRYFRNAAEQGHPKAQERLGFYYYGGLGVKRNPVEAVIWFRRAAEQGLPKAQCNLAICLENGQGAATNFVEAAQWYKKAADQNDPSALFNLGLMQSRGTGVPKDATKAVVLWERAAQAGHSKAQQVLANCYATGAGVPLNPARALALYREAIKTGATLSPKDQTRMDALIQNERNHPKDFSIADGQARISVAPEKPPSGMLAPLFPKAATGRADTETASSKPAARRSIEPQPAQSSRPSRTAQPPAKPAERQAPALEPAPGDRTEGNFVLIEPEENPGIEEEERAITQSSNNAAPGTTFAGIPSNDPCNRAYWKMSGVPWKISPDKPVTVVSNAPQPAVAFTGPEFKAVVTRCMEGMRVVYGPMAPAQAREYNQLWSPFFDFPNSSCYIYFRKLLGFVDEFIRLNSQAIATTTTFEESLQMAALLAQSGDERGARPALDSAHLHAQTLRDIRTQLQGVVTRMQALGDPPNPLNEQCNARKRHNKALGKLLQPAEKLVPGTWVLVKKWNKTEKPDSKTDYVTATAKVTSDTLVLDFYEERRRNQKGLLETTCSIKQLLAWNIPTRIRSGEPLPIRMQIKDAGSPLPDDRMGGRIQCHVYHRNYVDSNNVPARSINWDYDSLTRILQHPENTSPAVQIMCILDGINVTKEFYEQSLERSRVSPMPLGSTNGYDRLLISVNWGGHAVSGFCFYLYQFQPEGAMVRGTDLDVSKPAIDWTAAEAMAQRNEAIAQRQTVAENIEKNLERIRAEMKTLASDPQVSSTDERFASLQRKILGQEANLQSEQDAIMSLRTGVTIHTRTGWDEVEHQNFVKKVEKEVRELGAENRFINGLGHAALQIQGIEGVETGEWVQKQIQEAIHSGNRLERLQKIGSVVQDKLAAQQAQAESKEADANFNYETAMNVRQTADTCIMLGSLFVPGVGQISMGYGIGTGFGDGGPAKAFENASRAYSDTVDVLWSGVEGYREIDPKTGKPRGWYNAVNNAATTFVMNKVMEKFGGILQGDGHLDAPHGSEPSSPGKPHPATAPVAHPDPNYKPKTKSAFEAFKDGNTRLEEDLSALKQKHGENADPAKNPEYAKELAEVNKKHAIVIKRHADEKRLADTLAAHEKRIPPAARNPDGTVNPDHEEYKAIKKEWEGEMAKIEAENKQGFDERRVDHESAMDEAGLTRDKDGKCNEMAWSGGVPKSDMSDIDLAAKTLAAGRKYTATMEKRGHNVLEFHDRWVITDTDTTIWKPAEALPAHVIGSASHEGRIAMDTATGSDKFPTLGGVYYTTRGKMGVYDPRGAVLSNIKKATEAGIGGHGDNANLHVIGKSLDKAIEIANLPKNGQPLEAPDFLVKARAVKGHKTPEQSGIVTFGNPPNVKAKEKDAFLDEARTLMNSAYQKSADASRHIEATYENNVQYALLCKKKDQARKMKESLIMNRVSNNATLRTLADMDPKFIGQITGVELKAMTPTASHSSGAQPGGTRPDATTTSANTSTDTGKGTWSGGLGWLWQNMKGEPADAPAPPALPQLPPSPGLTALSDRCQKASALVATQVLPAVRTDPESMKHFEVLKTALETAARNPAQGALLVRQETGSELSTLLAELEKIQNPKGTR